MCSIRWRDTENNQAKKPHLKLIQLCLFVSQRGFEVNVSQSGLHLLQPSPALFLPGLKLPPLVHAGLQVTFGLQQTTVICILTVFVWVSLEMLSRSHDECLHVSYQTLCASQNTTARAIGKASKSACTRHDTVSQHVFAGVMIILGLPVSLQALYGSQGGNIIMSPPCHTCSKHTFGRTTMKASHQVCRPFVFFQDDLTTLLCLQTNSPSPQP